MRILFALIASLLLVSVAVPARADAPAIDLRVVVPSGGTSFPERDGTPVRLGPSLLTAPFTVTDARAVGSEVRLTLAPATARGFAALTAAHRGDRVAILAGGVVQSAPVIRAPISGGKVSITLRSAADAIALARTLTAR
jgi:hypothetical protein